ncbi:MAG TPA: LysR substrate-binding domain-containing protein [Acidobacteriaceae bacterium]|jgi:DNA-binding transcriptional LysR family regulator|nr:LysR substrate-binding domain-containing protein [Acidobacteriaceae bacterium]
MKDAIELRHLRYFLAVAETLHFGRAAQKLGMAQPPLSQQIKRLEEMIGAPLFERTTRGVTLTPAGAMLRERATATIARLADDLEQTRRVACGEEGRLRVGFSGSVMFTELPAAIQRYRRAYPRVEVQLREMWTSEQLPALADGSIDVGFLRDGERRPELAITPLLREPFHVTLPADHMLRRQRTVDPRSLEGEPFVLFSRRMGVLAYDRTIRCCLDAGFQPQIVQEAPQFPTLIRLVAAGLGISLVPAGVATVAFPGAIFRPIRSKRWTSVDIGTRVDGVSATATAFVETVRAHFEAAKYS